MFDWCTLATSVVFYGCYQHLSFVGLQNDWLRARDVCQQSYIENSYTLGCIEDTMQAASRLPLICVSWIYFPVSSQISAWLEGLITAHYRHIENAPARLIAACGPSSSRKLYNRGFCKELARNGWLDACLLHNHEYITRGPTRQSLTAFRIWPPSQCRQRDDQRLGCCWLGV